jgi:hypothetical protein
LVFQLGRQPAIEYDRTLAKRIGEGGDHQSNL